VLQVSLWDEPVEDVRPLLTAERTDLLTFLDSLTPVEWNTETAAPGWTVKDVALHLLDDDLGWLSRLRDEDRSGRLDASDPASFVAALAEKNQRWIDGARRLSLPVVAGLLRWAGHEIDDWYASLDLMTEGGVYWASDGPVPMWFDIAQDLTERWVHQRQMRAAVQRVEDYDTRYLPTVLRTFAWAFPHQYRVSAAAGTQVGVRLDGGGVWTLVSDGQGRWSMRVGEPEFAAASLWASQQAGWRLLTGAEVPDGGVLLEGPGELSDPLRLVRGIIV
jgi:hypothetical protein